MIRDDDDEEENDDDDEKKNSFPANFLLSEVIRSAKICDDEWGIGSENSDSSNGKRCCDFCRS
jgi:hypothetical protein